MNIQNFIERAHMLYNGKYDYSKLTTADWHSTIVVICPEHGEFTVTPANHLQETACPECAREKRKQAFIDKANEVHNYKYDYSNVDYKNQNSRVEVICPEHGPFTIKASTHLINGSCPVCAKAQQLKSNEAVFIEKAKQKYGNKYDYSHVEYQRQDKKIKIICPEHGEFEVTPTAFLNGQGCQECRKEQGLLQRTKDFVKKAKDVYGTKYDYSSCGFTDLNTDITLCCPEHGIFTITPVKHLRGRECPECEQIKKNQDFIDKAKAQHGEKYDYSGCHYESFTKQVEIICSEHGIFKMTPARHLKGYGCPICLKEEKNRKRLLAFIKEADEVHDGKYDYSDVIYKNAQTKVNITCPEHGQFSLTPIVHLSGAGCPKCDGKVPEIGKTDLVTLFPYLTDEWDYNLNESLNPEEFLPNSSRKVWWKCPLCGKTYESPIHQRTKYNAKCPYCHRVNFSFSEKCIAFYLRKFSSYHVEENHQFPDPSDGKKSVEADVLIEELKIVIEHDGSYWHGHKKRDSGRDDYKTKFFEGLGYRVIRIEEKTEGETGIEGDTICYNYRHANFSSYSEAIGLLLDLLNIPHNKISIQDDYAFIYKEHIQYYKERSFGAKYPELAKDWDYDKNEGITPENVLPRSVAVFWWKCHRCGTEYRASVSKVVERGSRCRVCRNLDIAEGINDFASRHPELAKEWNYERNNGLLPTQITHNSGKKVWWKRWSEETQEFQEWEMSVSQRIKLGDDFVYHYRGGVIPGANDLATLQPELLERWDYDKNEELGIVPNKVRPNSTMKVWWKHWSDRDNCWHEWEAKPLNMTQGGKDRCPICAGMLVITGVNDFASAYPELLSEWSPKNEKSPNELSRGTTHKAIWFHEIDGVVHEWEASMHDRAIKHTACPICTNKKFLKGFNDMLAKHPHFAEIWSEKNEERPEDILCTKRSREVIWKETCGHEFTMTIGEKLRHENDPHYCPICACRVTVPGENDLATVYPEVAAEWDYEKNDGLSPSDVRITSSEKFWWRDENGKSWNAMVRSRIKTLYGHPPTINDSPRFLSKEREQEEQNE